MMLLMETQHRTVPTAPSGARGQDYQHHMAEHQQELEAWPVEAVARGQEQFDGDSSQEQRVLQPLEPVLQLLPVQLLDVQYASAHVAWQPATYTLPDHEHDDEQVAYQLQVHYRVSYTLQVQQAPVGPPTTTESAEQLLSSVPSAVVETAWKDVMTLQDPPAQGQKVPALRAGRFYAVRLRAHASAELDTGPVVFSQTYTSDVLAFRTLPCTPGQMQAPSLARRDRTLLKLKWNLPDETGGEMITQYQLKVKPSPPGFACSQPDEEGFAVIYEGLGEGPEQAKDRTHFTLKPLGPGQKFSFRIRCFNGLGVGNWSLPSTFTTAPSVPAQPDPPQLLESTPESVTLCWQAPADMGSAITFYKLEIDDGRGGDFQHVYGGQAEQLSAAIAGLQSGLHYRVRLRAENSEGRSLWSVPTPISTAATRPSCPVGLKLGQVTRNAVSLSWSPPNDDGGSPVNGYEVQLLAVSKVAVADLGNDWLTIHQGPALSTNWSSLRAGCKYQLRVAACNSMGSSSFSIPLSFVTAPDAPLPPPRPTALLESRALFIALQPPVHDGGSVVTGYSIFMRCNPQAAAAAAATAACPNQPVPFMSSEWHEVWRGEYRGAAVPVLNLLPGTQYEFRAAACNAFGSSTPSDVGTATTRPAEPLPPLMPHLLSSAGNSLTVSWQEPYGQGSAVTKYKLTYACLGPVGAGSAVANGHSMTNTQGAAVTANGHAQARPSMEGADDSGSASSSGGCSSSGPSIEKLRWEQAYTGPEVSAAVKQLLPAHRYLLRVSAMNDIGRSQWSQPLTASTAAAAPCRPTHVSGAAQSSSSVLVSWQPPEVDNGAPVTTYHLEVQAATGPWTHVWQGKELSHAVGGLQPGRTYSWRVRGINSCGPGPWSEAVSACTTPAVPDAPGKPSVSKVAATSAKVKWNIPLEDNGAAVKAYAVQLRHAKAGSAAIVVAAAAADGSSSEAESEASAGEFEWQEVYSGPLLEHTLTKLQPGSSYEVRVAAANAVGQGRWSSAAVLHTPLRPPPPPADLAAVPDEAQLGSVAVSWQQPAGAGADSAAVVSVYLEAAAPGSKEAAAKATVSAAEGCRAVLQGLRPGRTYHIRARSVGAGGSGHSQYCDAVNVVLPAPLVAADEAEGAGALVAVDAGKRSSKARGSKGSAGKAAAKGEVGGPLADAQQRKAVRGKKGAAVVEEVVGPTAKKPMKKRSLFKRVTKHSYFWPVVMVLFIVALVIYWWRSRAKAQAELA